MEYVFIGLPAYNESLALPKLLEKISGVKKILESRNIKIFVVINNDGSTDDTKIVSEVYLRNFEIEGEVLNSIQNEGLGQGVRNILKYFLGQSTENSSLVLMDSDDTHDPIQIIELLEWSSQSDVVIASRFKKGSLISGVPRFRILTGNLARLYLQMLYPFSGVKDFTCGYRLYKREPLLNLQKNYPSFFQHNGFAAMPELLLNLLAEKNKCVEIPLNLRYDNKPTPSSMKVLRNSFQIIILGFSSRIRMFYK